MYRKEIVYSREMRDYACYLDNELVAYARTYSDGETLLDNLVFELLSGQYFADMLSPANVQQEQRQTEADTADIEADRAEHEAGSIALDQLAAEHQYAA